MILASILCMLPDLILEVCLNGECFTKKEMFQQKKKREEAITVNLTMLQLMLEDYLQSIGSISRSSVGTIQVYGYGEERTSSCRLKYGCAEETQFGFHAPELLMSIEDIPAHRVTLEVLQINSKDSLQL